MPRVEQLIVRGGADFSAIKREMDKTQKQMLAFKESMSASLRGIGTALAAIGIGFALGDAIKEAMKVEGAIGQINRLMGDSAGEFLNWAATSAQAFGMSKGDALDFGRTYANIISSFATSTGQTMNYTTSLLKASAVIASSTGRTMEDVMERIRSGMLGNTEAIEDLGVNVNVAMIQSTDAFKKFANGKSWGQLSFQTQQQIRYFAILEQTSKKFGTELQDNTQTKLLVFTANLKNLQLALGQAFLPILNVVLPILTSFVSKIASAMEFVAEFSKALFGGNAAKDAQSQASSVGAVSDAYQNAGDSAKQAAKDQKGFLAGFDEVNAMSAQKGSSSGGAGTGGNATSDGSNVGSAIDASKITGVLGKAQELAATVKLFFDQLANSVSYLWNSVIVSFANYIGSSFITLWTNVKAAYDANAAAVNGVAQAITIFFLPALIKTGVEATIAGTKIAVEFIATLIKSGVEATISAAKITTSFIASIIQTGVQAVKTGAILTGQLISAIITYGLEGWKTVASITAQTAAVIAQGTAWVAQKVALAASALITGTMTAAQWALNAALSANPIGLVILGIGALIAAGVLLYKNWDVVKKYAGQLWDKVKEVGKGIEDALSSAFTNAWTAIKGPLNSIIGGINSLITGLNSLQIDIPDWMPGGGKKFGINIPTIPKLAQGGIVNSPTMAMIGEAGPEMVVPLEQTSFTDKLAGALGTAVMSAMQMSGGSNVTGSNKEVILKIDGYTIARALNPYLKKESNRQGNTVISIY